MSRILKRKEWDRNDLLQIALYYDFIQKNEDGWFNVDEIINYISGIRRCQNKPEYDFQTLEKHVYNDVDHRYIFNEDKTLLRISPDHISPKYVEEELKNAGTIKVKQSVFKKNNLEFVKDETRKIIITSGNGRRWFFPYETNRIFYIDDKRFFMPVELTRGSAVAVSAYLNKHTKYSYQYRMAFIDFPAVLNYIHALNSELADYEGNTYRICIEQVSEQAVEKTTDKSLEELENDYWDKPGYKSYVVTTCFAARKKPLSELSNEEIRLLIGQKLGLKYLLPLAIDILKTDPLIEVTFFPGDLLYQLLKLDFKDWIDNKEERDSLLKIVINNRSKIEENTEIPEDCKKEMLELLSGIEKYDRHRNSTVRRTRHMEIKAINYLQKDYINEEDFFCSAEVLIGTETEDFVYETYMFHVISIKRLYDNYQNIEDEGVMLNKGWIITKYYNEKAIANEIKLILERCESSSVQEAYTKLDSYFIRE